jgi:hypothetical protein
MRGQRLVFGAFVTHQPATDEESHIRDAKAAITKFQEGMQRPVEFKSAVIEPNCFNLVGAALLRTGWTMDQSALSQACLVVRHKGS